MIPIFFFSLYFVIPICGAFLIGSLPALIYSAAAYIIFTGYMIKRERLLLSVASITAVICAAALSAMGMAFLSLILDIGQPIIITDTFAQKQIRQTLMNTPFIGSSYEISDFLPENRNDYPLAFLAANFGTVTIFITILAYMGFLYFMARSALRQNTQIGSMIAWTVNIITGVQFAFSTLCNLGIVGGSTLSFPFLTGGGSFTVVNFVLFGILLSVCRNEDIAKDRIKLLTKHKGETS